MIGDFNSFLRQLLGGTVGQPINPMTSGVSDIGAPIQPLPGPSLSEVTRLAPNRYYVPPSGDPGIDFARMLFQRLNDSPSNYVFPPGQITGIKGLFGGNPYVPPPVIAYSHGAPDLAIAGRPGMYAPQTGAGSNQDIG